MQLALSTWHEVEDYLRTSRGIIIPIGSTEQHGPNGLIGTDHLDAEFVARGVGDEIGCLVAPTLTIGMSQHHLGFAGSITLRPSTLIALVGDVVTSLTKHGFERFLFINGHGGNVATVTAAFDEIYAASSMRGRTNPRRCAARWCSGRRGRDPTALAKELYGDANGSHATASEVSLAQHYQPQAIKHAQMSPKVAPKKHRLLRLRRLSPPIRGRPHRLRPVAVHAGARRADLSGGGRGHDRGVSRLRRRLMIDPIRLEIIRGAIRAAQAEMDALLERTAISAFIREKKDFYTALFDADGVMVVGSMVPIFGDITGPVFARFAPETMREGDLYWYSDCYASRGAVSHSNDQVFLAPVFHDGRRAAFVMGWAHFSDIGGLRPGSISSDATDIFQEGIIIPPTKLIDAGTVNEAALEIFHRNSRYPAQSRGDTRALMASVDLGVRRVAEILRRFGPDVMAEAFARLFTRTRELVRARLRETFAVGTHRFSDAIEFRRPRQRPVPHPAGADPHRGRPLHPRRHRDRRSGAWAGELPDEPRRAGDGARLVLPGWRCGAGVQRRWPSCAGRGAVARGLAAVAAVSRAARAARHDDDAVPRGAERAGECRRRQRAGFPFRLRDHHAARHAGGKPFLMSDGVGVGYGARPTTDGIDAVYFVAQENYPVEFLEQGYPVRLLRYGINRDSGGPGKFRGGAGVVREYEVLAEHAVLSMRIDSVVNPPWGVGGGMRGGTGRAVVNPGTPHERKLAPLSDGTVLRRGDILLLETGGGGGHGHPFDRPAEQVLQDVRDGFVSVAAARRDYGVVDRRRRTG